MVLRRLFEWQAHGFYVDNDGTVWAADNGVLNGKGAIVVKFSPMNNISPNTKTAMRLRRRGWGGSRARTANRPNNTHVPETAWDWSRPELR